ncbi:hypothetical protein MGYG_06868 [Nannizzia gypsea CBS 118893]|uniref:Uncharacterized protein n=1 Tax=Arthroderma gypseum (strain ATCC MYA-4604 / CBS 118893) TaxID=535722 RepID=E4V1F4_ARTGP|nr:hypothetical protein MGYG_06868 [Nannizzia gypsea CBS 118893]EFR03869.1 hypothetical protein MGYG_06868 [Nannizzia gypsea CBS 118893]
MTNQKEMGYGWLAKARFEQENALKQQSQNWKVARWQAYWEDVRKGTVKSIKYYILITSLGLFTSPEKLQEIAGLPSTPELHTTVKLENMDDKPTAEPRRKRKSNTAHGPIGAWLAYSLKADDRQWDDFREACRKGAITYTNGTYPIIISNSGPFTSPEKIQEALGLTALPEVKEAARAKFSEKTQPWTKEGDELQYCDVDLRYLDKIEEISDGEDILIWVDFKQRCGWLAHSMKSRVGCEDVNNSKENAE